MYCLCRMCCSMHCLCVNVYCTTATGCQPNCSWQIYRIISQMNLKVKRQKLSDCGLPECSTARSLKWPPTSEEKPLKWTQKLRPKRFPRMRNISEDRNLNVTELVILVRILQDYELTMPEKWDTPKIFSVALLYSTTCSITENDSWIRSSSNWSGCIPRRIKWKPV